MSTEAAAQEPFWIDGYGVHRVRPTPRRTRRSPDATFGGETRSDIAGSDTAGGDTTGHDAAAREGRPDPSRNDTD